MPDAQVVRKCKIEDTIEQEFSRYMGLPRSNPYAFGISAPNFYAKIKGVMESCVPEFAQLNGNAASVHFGKKSNDDLVLIHRLGESDCFEFLVNRCYNKLGKVASLGFADSFRVGDDDFSIYLTSSELCRGRAMELRCESVNDLLLNVINRTKDYQIPIRSHYALEDRSGNADVIRTMMEDVRKKVKAARNGFVDVGSLYDTMRKDEERRGIIFPEKLQNLQNGEVGFEVVGDKGFRVWYSQEGRPVSEPWNEVFFHSDYERAYIADPEGFRKLFEEVAYRVLKKKSNIRDKLEIISRIAENKEKFEKRYGHPKL